MSDSKNKKASNATAQASFLPPVNYPPELAKATDALVRVGDQVYVRIDAVTNPPDPALNRYSSAEWKAQLASYRMLGIKTAIHVRTVPGGYWLEDGRHRVLGAQELGWSYVKADVDGAGNAATSAVWRFEANARRKADRPLDQAIAWHEMMSGAGMTQKQVADVAGVSQATISRRLRLLDLPRELAMRVGEVDDACLEPVFAVRGDAKLLEVASAAALKALRRDADTEDVLDACIQAWSEAGLAIAAEDEALPYEVRDDPAFAKAEASLAPLTIKVPSPYGDAREVVVYRNRAAALDLAKKIAQRLEEERIAMEAKLAAKAAKQGKKVKTLPDGSKAIVEAPKRRSLAERVPEQRTKVQLELLARFLPAQIAFPDEFVTEALARLVGHTPAITAIQDMEAACRALGMQMPKQEPNRLRSVRLTREIFHAAWKADQAAAMRMVAVALYFQARDYHKQLDDPVAGWVTGKNADDATTIAKQAIKDRDNGFKSVHDALCDHCDAPATLQKANINVCTSENYAAITPKSLAAKRLARKAQATDSV